MPPITETQIVPIAGQSSNSSDTVSTTTSTSAVPSASPAVPLTVTEPSVSATDASPAAPTYPLPAPVPPITPEAQLARVAQIFGPNIETIRLTAARSHGELLDAVKSVIVFEEPIIAIQCGTETGLCAVAFSCDRFDQLDAFLRANKWISHTVITYWREVMFIWLRLEGIRPTNLTTLDCRFISDGLVPVADLTGADSQDQFPAIGSTIKTVSLADIKWPKIEMQEPFLLQRLEHEHGKLIQVMPAGRVEVCVATATCFTATQLGLKYNNTTDGFTMAINGENPGPLETQRLHELISGWMTAQADKVGVQVPLDETVPAIIEALKARCGIGAPEGFRMYMNDCVERKVGATVTTKELLEAYRAYCARRGTAQYSGRDFYMQFAASAKELFGVTKSHNVKRAKLSGGTTALYGYRNLSVKSWEASARAE